MLRSPFAAKQAGGEEERVAGEEEADQQTGLGEDDHEQPDGPERVQELLRVDCVGDAGQDHRDRLDGAFCESRVRLV